jgi:hypothetical protein
LNAGTPRQVRRWTSSLIKKTARIAIAIFVAMLATVSVALMSLAQSSPWLSTASPNKTYTLQLTGKRRRPKVPGVEHEARFNLIKSSERVVSNAYVDSYDWFDSDFAEMYPEHKWINESTVRFGYELNKSERSQDSLIISNATDKPVRYLKITVRDMLFLFDVPSHSTVKLSVPHQGWLSWVAAEGLFVDGESLPFDGVNFFHRDRLDVPLQYCLTVAGGNIRIASTVVDGYNGDAKPEKPNAPKIARCEDLARS